MTSLETLLKEGTKVLEQHKIQEARLDAWLLLECDRDEQSLLFRSFS